MTKKYFVIGIGVTVLLAGCSKQTMTPTAETSQAGAQQAANASVMPATTPSQGGAITSSDKRVSFQYPPGFSVTKNPDGGNGKFGKIIESWTLKSSQMVGQDPAASVLVEIEAGGGNLSVDQLVDCSGKMTCDKIGIDSEQFIKSTGTLNTGAVQTAVASFYDNNILRMTATIASGNTQQANLSAVNQIFNSINFSQ